VTDDEDLEQVREETVRPGPHPSRLPRQWLHLGMQTRCSRSQNELSYAP